jgi:hypothetical protein
MVDPPAVGAFTIPSWGVFVLPVELVHEFCVSALPISGPQKFRSPQMSKVTSGITDVDTVEDHEFGDDEIPPPQFLMASSKVTVGISSFFA